MHIAMQENEPSYGPQLHWLSHKNRKIGQKKDIQ